MVLTSLITRSVGIHIRISLPSQYRLAQHRKLCNNDHMEDGEVTVIGGGPGLRKGDMVEAKQLIPFLFRWEFST